MEQKLQDKTTGELINVVKTMDEYGFISTKVLELEKKYERSSN